MRKLIFIVVILISFLIINNLARSIYGLWQKRELITDAKRELSSEKKKNFELSDEMSEVGSSEFLEEEARNKLFLVKPGEEIVIVPREDTSSISSTRRVRVVPIWKQWLIYFKFDS